MNINSNLIALLQARKGMITADVRITNSSNTTMRSKERTYTYKVPTTLDLEKGDVVVVQVGVDGLVIGRVAEVHDVAMIDPEAEFDYRWIVQRVDTDFIKSMAEEENAIRRKLVQAEMMQKLEAAAKLACLDIDAISTPVLEGKK
jgi:hypothetical protein